VVLGVNIKIIMIIIVMNLSYMWCSWRRFGDSQLTTAFTWHKKEEVLGGVIIIIIISISYYANTNTNTNRK